MNFGARRSIVFHLWLRLSVLTVTFALLALGAYLWLAISDSTDNAHGRAEARSAAILTALARITTTGSAPTSAELGVANNLGIVLLQRTDESGNVVSTFGKLAGEGVLDPVPAKTLGEDALEHDHARHDIQFVNGGFRVTSLNPLKVLRGGDYGSIHYYPLEMLVPGQDGGLRVAATYEDISGEAVTMLLRSVALTGGILGVVLLGMWILLNDLVARPLRAYSDTVMRIAAGDPVRMPQTAKDEMGQLGRAVNGMADALRHQATVDPLTGLYNLRHLTSRLEILMDEARNTGSPLALISCDIDNLKPINDTYGHPAGDLVLKA
ncbi:MAG: GGDEF domain-containing protein, partial [Nitrospiraceae bacterium]